MNLDNISSEQFIKSCSENGFEPVPGFDGYYITKSGRFVTTRRKTVKELSFSISNRGNLRVSMSPTKGVKGKMQTAHRIMWDTFKGPTDRDISFLDGDKSNISLSNLFEVVTDKEVGNDAHKKAVDEAIASGGKKYSNFDRYIFPDSSRVSIDRNGNKLYYEAIPPEENVKIDSYNSKLAKLWGDLFVPDGMVYYFGNSFSEFTTIDLNDGGWHQTHEGSNYYFSESGEVVSVNKSHPSRCNVLAPATSDSGYKVMVIKEDGHPLKNVSVHRALMIAVHGEDALRGMLVDHINGDRSDNRLCNLRIVSHSDNAKNRHSNYPSRVPGYYPQTGDLKQISDQRYSGYLIDENGNVFSEKSGQVI